MCVELTSNFQTKFVGNSLIILEGAFRDKGVLRSIHLTKLNEGAQWDVSDLEKIRKIYVEQIYRLHKGKVTYRPPGYCSVKPAKFAMQKMSALLFKFSDDVEDRLEQTARKFARKHPNSFLSQLSYQRPIHRPERALVALDTLLKSKIPAVEGDALELWRWFQKMYRSILSLCHRDKTAAAFDAVSLLPLCLDRDTTPLCEALVHNDSRN